MSNSHCPPGATRPPSFESNFLTVDLDALDRDGVVAVLDDARRLRSRLDALELRAHRRLRELEAIGASEPANAAVAAAADGDGRHGRSVSERDELCLDAPEVEDALDAGSVSGAHLDAITAACRNLPDDVRAEFLGHTDSLMKRAARLSIDAFRRECRRLAKHLLTRSDHSNGTDELERQRAASKVTRWTDRSTGMCATLIELDPVRDSALSNAVRREITRLRNTDGNGELSWKQLEVQAWVNCTTGATTASSTNSEITASSARPTGTTGDNNRTVDRSPQIVAVADVAALRDGVADAVRSGRLDPNLLCETSDGRDLPIETLRRLCCDAEIIPAVMDGPSSVLDVGRSRRTATAEQRHALRAMHSTLRIPWVRRAVRRLPDPSRRVLDPRCRPDRPGESAPDLRARPPPGPRRRLGRPTRTRSHRRVDPARRNDPPSRIDDEPSSCLTPAPGLPAPGSCTRSPHRGRFRSRVDRAIGVPWRGLWPRQRTTEPVPRSTRTSRRSPVPYSTSPYSTSPSSTSPSSQPVTLISSWPTSAHAMEAAAQYRRRARSLRMLASSLEALPLMQLDSLAGPGTWRGPRPFRSSEELRTYQQRLHRDAERLRNHAWALEVRATDLERSAAVSGIA